MATTITGKLNKPANQFQAGDSTGFGIRLGVKYRDPKTKQDDWCNYSAVIFAKSPNQVQFYQDSLVEGSVVEVSAEQLCVESFDGNNGPMLTINMLNARLGYIHTGQQPQQGYQQQARQPQQQNYQQPVQQQNPNAQAGYQGRQNGQAAPSYDRDIPF